MPDIPITSLPSRLQRQAEQARTALDRGNTEYAINICRDILRSHPGCLQVRRLLRAAQLKIFRGRNRLLAKTMGGLSSAPVLLSAQALLKKDPARALEAAEQALSSDPTNTAMLRVVAQAAMTLDLPETAVFALEAVRERAPRNRDVLVQLADAYIAAGRTREALAIAEALLREAPADGELQELLKRASVAQSISEGRWDSGSGSFRDKLRDEEQAISLEQSSKVMMSEAMTQRLVDEAIARIATEPGNLTHYRTVVSGCRSLGRLDEALHWLARARQLPSGAADVTLEKLASDLRVAQAEQRVQERENEVVAAGGDPASDARVKQLRDEFTRSKIAELRSFAEKYPNEQGYKFDLGQLYRATGQLDLAIQQLQFAQRHPSYRVRALMSLGSCFQAKGLHDLAVQQFETAKSEIPAFDEQKKEAIYQLAACFEAMGQPERALEEYKLIYSADIGFRDVAAKIDRSYQRG